MNNNKNFNAGLACLAILVFGILMAIAIVADTILRLNGTSMWASMW